MTYGLSMLIMACIAAGSVLVILWTLMSDQSTDEQIESRSRVRIQGELHRIQRDRPYLFVRSDDEAYNQMKEES